MSRQVQPIIRFTRLLCKKLYSGSGSLEVGKRADLLAVYNDGIVPRLAAAFCQGDRVT
jgi:alpha-D-ribose 1-methylphosphonate 5-triphosphate diphosphatase PhnM